MEQIDRDQQQPPLQPEHHHAIDNTVATNRHRQNNATTSTIATNASSRRYRRLRDIQVGMISDVVVRVVSYDQTRTLWPMTSRYRPKSNYGINHRRRYLQNVKIQTTCLLSDGPRDVDHMPLIVDRSGAVQRFDAILQRHCYDLASHHAEPIRRDGPTNDGSSRSSHNNIDSAVSPARPQPQLHQEQNSSSFLLRLTNVECQSHRHRTTAARGMSGPWMDDDQGRVLVPTLATQAMEIPWHEMYCDDNLMTASSLVTTLPRTFRPRYEDDANAIMASPRKNLSPSMSSTTSIASPTLPPTDSNSSKTLSSSSLLQTQEAIVLSSLQRPQPNDHIVVHHSPMLDLCVDGVSLLSLPTSKWMNFLLSIPSVDNDSRPTPSTFRSATVTLSLPNERVASNTAHPLVVRAESNIVQTLCLSLSADELCSPVQSPFPRLVTEWLAGVLPVPNPKGNHDTTSIDTSFLWYLLPIPQETLQHSDRGSRVKYNVQQVRMDSFPYPHSLLRVSIR